MSNFNCSFLFNKRGHFSEIQIPEFSLIFSPRTTAVCANLLHFKEPFVSDYSLFLLNIRYIFELQNSSRVKFGWALFICKISKFLAFILKRRLFQWCLFIYWKLYTFLSHKIPELTYEIFSWKIFNKH
jgi:hypothetical protein